MGREARREYEEHYTADKNYELLRQIYEQTIESHTRSKTVRGAA
jgi:hypothetical protein